jgi:hypothetical protein
MPDIELTFINKSNDRNNSEIVVFQKNQAVSVGELAIAWLVIKNCGQGWRHPFQYPVEMFAAASDSWGNFSLQLQASYGQQFEVTENQSGDTLKYAGPATSPDEVELLNALPTGAVNAHIYKSGRLLAVKTGIAPGQKAVFQFKPTIWLGVASQVEEGGVMNSAIMSGINTEISLFGIKSADIVMTGGGPGVSATPFVFTLENIVYA